MAVFLKKKKNFHAVAKEIMMAEQNRTGAVTQPTSIWWNLGVRNPYHIFQTTEQPVCRPKLKCGLLALTKPVELHPH